MPLSPSPELQVKNDPQTLHEDAKRKKRKRNVEHWHRKDSLDRFLKARPLPDAEYTVDTVVSKRAGTKQHDVHLAKKLSDNATNPVTSDVVKDFVQSNRKEGLNQLCRQLHDALIEPPRFDVHTPSTNEELERALRCPFKCIFLDSKTDLTYTHHWTIRKQVDAMGGADGPACQPARKLDRDHSTHDISNDALRRCFIDNSPLAQEVGTNILDCHNHSGHCFWPDAVSHADVVQQILHRRRQGSWARDAQRPVDSSPDATVDPGWMIMSYGPTVSPFHADAAGYCTVTVGLEGRKIWHSPNGVWEYHRRRFRENGPYGVHYSGGVYKLQLGPGDSIITPPGYIHAVYTPKGCALLAGHFLYTAEYFDRSLRCVLLQYAGEIHTNDGIKQEDFRRLAFVVENLDLEGLFSELQLEAIFFSIEDLLQHVGIIKRRSAGWVRVWVEEEETEVTKLRLYTYKITRKGQSPDPGTLKEELRFLSSCAKFHWPRRTISDDSER